MENGQQKRFSLWWCCFAPYFPSSKLFSRLEFAFPLDILHQSTEEMNRLELENNAASYNNINSSKRLRTTYKKISICDNLIECSTQIHRIRGSPSSSTRRRRGKVVCANGKHEREHEVIQWASRIKIVYYLYFSLAWIWPFQAIFSRTSKHAAYLSTLHRNFFMIFFHPSNIQNILSLLWRNYDEEKMRN